MCITTLRPSDDTEKKLQSAYSQGTLNPPSVSTSSTAIWACTNTRLRRHGCKTRSVEVLNRDHTPRKLMREGPTQPPTHSHLKKQTLLSLHDASVREKLRWSCRSDVGAEWRGMDRRLSYWEAMVRGHLEQENGPFRHSRRRRQPASSLSVLGDTPSETTTNRRRIFTCPSNACVSTRNRIVRFFHF